MVTDSLFDEVTFQVRNVCDSLKCSCSFNRELTYINVYGRLTGQGRLIITSTVIDAISSIPYVQFNSVSLDSSCRLCALFFISDSDGNSIKSD